jgi:hypothetical protein
MSNSTIRVMQVRSVWWSGLGRAWSPGIALEELAEGVPRIHLVLAGGADVASVTVIVATSR